MTAHPAHVLVDAAEAEVARRWLERATQHVAVSIERALRGGALPAPSAEQMALAVMREAGHELAAAAQALTEAARVLKDKGFILPASRAHHAAQNATRAARELGDGR